MQKILHNTYFEYIGGFDLRFCSIGLKFGPHIYKEFY